MTRTPIRFLATLAATCCALGLSTGAASAASPDFALRINDGLLDHSVTSAFVEPGEAIRVAARDLPRGAKMSLAADGHGLRVKHTRTAAWRIEAPARPGVYPIVITNRRAGTHRRVNLFVMQHFDARHDSLSGYRIGHYQPTARHGREIYDPPDALMPVTQADTDARLSAHFTIGQFLCHQQPGHWPKYVLVRPKLVAKLEAILAALNDRGIHARTLTVMSGYRTPAYNADIGNTTVYSRHLYGGAADIYVDTNHDGRMDDLNGDGTVDEQDAEWLADLIASLDKANPRFVGGLSAYHSTTAHGPFVHTDVRGVAARW